MVAESTIVLQRDGILSVSMGKSLTFSNQEVKIIVELTLSLIIGAAGGQAVRYSLISILRLSN